MTGPGNESTRSPASNRTNARPGGSSSNPPPRSTPTAVRPFDSVQRTGGGKIAMHARGSGDSQKRMMPSLVFANGLTRPTAVRRYAEERLDTPA